MRNRKYRRAGSQQPTAISEVPDSKTGGVAPEKKQSSDVKKGRKTWMGIASDVARLALDLIRVAGEGTDLYRKIRFEK